MNESTSLPAENPESGPLLTKPNTDQQISLPAENPESGPLLTKPNTDQQISLPENPESEPLLFSLAELSRYYLDIAWIYWQHMRCALYTRLSSSPAELNRYLGIAHTRLSASPAELNRYLGIAHTRLSSSLAELNRYLDIAWNYWQPMRRALHTRLSFSPDHLSVVLALGGGILFLLFTLLVTWLFSYSGGPVPPISSKPRVIAVMGVTGVGKSTFIQTLTKDTNITIGHDLESCTKTVQHSNLSIEIESGIPYNITLVDTPGLDDSRSEHTDDRITKEINDWLNDMYDHDTKLTGIIYLHRITDERIGGSGARNLKMMTDLVGKENMKNVILVTTRWEMAANNPKQFQTREAQLINKTNDKKGFWYDLITTHGASYARHDGSYTSTKSILSQIAKNSPVELPQGTREMYERLSAKLKILEEAIEILREREKNLESVVRTLRGKEKNLEEEIRTLRGKEKNLEEKIRILRESKKNLEEEIKVLREKDTDQISFSPVGLCFFLIFVFAFGCAAGKNG